MFSALQSGAESLPTAPLTPRDWSAGTFVPVEEITAKQDRGAARFGRTHPLHPTARNDREPPSKPATRKIANLYFEGDVLPPSRIPLGMIRKLKSGEFRIYSRKKNAKTGKRRNLGTFATREQAQQHERDIQYFKHH